MTSHYRQFAASLKPIKEMVNIDATNEDIIAALEQQGFHTSTRTLKCRLRDWGVRRTNRQVINDVVPVRNYSPLLTLLRQ